jgi:hypothetical protein
MGHDLLYRYMYNHLRHLKRSERLKSYMPFYKECTIEIIDIYKVEIVDEGDYEQIYILNQSNQRIVIDLDKKDSYAALNCVCPEPEKAKEMIDIALDILNKRGIKKVQMNDKASIKCNGESISFSLVHFFKYGETWYESIFGFKPTLKFQKRYEEVKNKRREVFHLDKIQNAPCAVFTFKNMDLFLDKIDFEFYFDIIWEKIL